MQKTTLFPLFLTLLSFFSVSALQPHFPHIVYGFVKYNGAGIAGVNVTFENERTGEKLYNITNRDGYFSISLGDMPSGWEDGDRIKITARKNELMGISYLIVDENTGSQQVNVTLIPPPVADFTYQPQHPFANESVKFYCHSNATFFQWNFDDGNISTERNPEHIFSKPGNYSVTLTIKDKFGRTDSTSKIITIKQPPSHGTTEPQGSAAPWIAGILAAIAAFVILFFLWKNLK